MERVQRCKEEETLRAIMRADPNEKYLINFARLCAASNEAKNQALSFEERCDVERRVERARQKCAFWERRPNFRYDLIDKEIQAIKRIFAV